MKNLQLILFVLITVISWNHSVAQADKIEKGRFFTTEGRTIIFQDLSMSEDTYRFKSSTNSSLQEIPAEYIVKIEQQTGTEAGKWALWCGLSGLVGSSLGVLQAKSQTPGVESNGTSIIFGLTAVSVLVGAAIGAGQKKYTEVKVKPSTVSESGFMESRIKLDLAIGSQKGSISLNYTF